MKIERIEVYGVSLHLTTPIRLSRQRHYHSCDSTIVRLVTDDGVAGWGEGCPWGPTYGAEFADGVRAGIALLAPSILGQDPLQIDRLAHGMDRALMGHWYVKSAVDLACWDIVGKATERPACDVLGGRFDGPLRLNRPVMSGPPESMREQVSALRATGVRVFSCKLDGDDPAADAERINVLLKDRRPGERYTADFNGALSVAGAMAFSHSVESPHLLIEQPCRTYGECLKLHGSIRHAIRLDEAVSTPDDALRAISDGCCEGLVIKIGRVGGLTKARRIRDLCVLAGLPVSVQDTGGSEIVTAAVLNLARATPPDNLHSVVDLRLFVDQTTADGLPASEHGEMVICNRPGLGVTPRHEVLGKPLATYP